MLNGLSKNLGVDIDVITFTILLNRLIIKYGVNDMKKMNRLFTSMVLSMALLMTACSQGNSEETMKDPKVEEVTPTEAATPKAEPETKKYSVAFIDQDGTTELSTVEVEEGGLATEYVPEKENAIFMGWFGTPSLSHNFDFTKPITQDTKIFAGFLENKEDTREFFIVGSGKSPLLLKSNWGKEVTEEHSMTKADGANTYSITLDLHADDEFQFVINSAWQNQRGAGYMESSSLDGVDYFFNSGGAFATDTKKSNIKCVKPGNYTLTLTTYPGADYYDEENEYYTEENREGFNMNPYDTITWVYNGELADVVDDKAAASDLKVTYYIKGAIITEWQDQYDDQFRFTEADGVHTLTIELVEGDEFLFTTLVGEGDAAAVGTDYVRFSNIQDETSLGYLEGSASYNMITKAAGTYTFTYQASTTELTVTFVAK